jgi:hypothetical protein
MHLFSFYPHSFVAGTVQALITTYGRVVLKLSAFLISELDGVKYSKSSI